MPANSADREAVIYLYVLGASPNPDKVECRVPWEVDRKEIFFGPCKKSLRQRFKSELLGDKDEVVPTSNIYVVGLNALPGKRGPRKIVWIGRVTRVMTFAAAFKRFQGKRYGKMLAIDESPLHVEPIEARNGRFLGYRFRENGAHPKSWHRDLITSSRGVRRDGDSLRLENGWSRPEAFARDACFTAENIFFARKTGIPIDADFVRVLRQAQEGVAERVGKVAVFGRRNGIPNGLRGRYLTIHIPDQVEEALEWILEKARKARPAQAPRLQAPSGGQRRRMCA